MQLDWEQVFVDFVFRGKFWYRCI